MMRFTLHLTVAAVLATALSACAGQRSGPPDTNGSEEQRRALPRGAKGRFNVGFRVLDFKPAGGGKTVTVAVWYPTDAEEKRHIYGGSTEGRVAADAPPRARGGPYPLLVFSHGYGGSGLGAVFLTEALVRRGWIVAAPDHNDRHSAVRIRGGARDFDRLGLLRHARKISESGPGDRDAYAYRLDEMKLVLDGMLKSGDFGRLIDARKVAVGGHSFGGFTALGLCGTIPARHEKRIRAVLLFSTGAGGYLFRKNELAALKIPSMLYLGERERRKGNRRGDKTMAQLAGKIYEGVASPKYFLEIKGATHFSFNNRFSDTLAATLLSGTAEQFDVIRRYSIAFLEKHVGGSRTADEVLRKKDPLLSRYDRQPAPAEAP